MNHPAAAGALEALIASTPPPVTVWGVRYLQPIDGDPAGYIAWCDTETEAREWLAYEQVDGHPVELVRITGRVHPADDTATCGCPMNATADRLRALAEGPALALPPVRWQAPTINEVRESARWGGERGTPSAYLLPKGTRLVPEPLIDIDVFYYTVGAARLLLDYLASAIAMAEEVSR